MKAELKSVPQPYVNVPSPDGLKRQQLAEIAHEVSAALDALKPGDTFPALAQEAMKLIRSPASNALQLKDFTNAAYRLSVSADIDLRLLHRNISFWSSLAGRGLQKFDDIRAVSDDECSMGDFIVIDADEKFVDCELIDFHKIQRRARSQGENAWLRDGDTLEMRPPKETLPGGYVIVRPNGVEITSSGIPFKDVETARRNYQDAAYNRDPTITQYFPR